MTLGEYPLINKPWFINPGLTLISLWIKTLELSWMFQWWTELWIELWFYPYSPWTMGSQGATKWVSPLQLNDRLISWEFNHCDLPRTGFLPLIYALVCHDFLAEFTASKGFVSYWKWLLSGSTMDLSSGWWFQTFFVFHNIWDNPSHWRTHIFQAG